MSDIIFKYQLDEEGTSPLNRVIDEVHVIGATRGRVFAADYGPFFGESVSMIDGMTGQPIGSTQYRLVHPYREARERTGKGVYAAVQIIDPDVSTRILFTAQMVGGEFSFSHYALAEAILALQNDNRPIEWNELIGLPSQWNPAPHTHSIYQTYAWEHMIWAVNDVAAAIREGDVASRDLLVKQLTLKIQEFEQIIDQEIAEALRNLTYIEIRQDMAVEADRRYIFMGDWIASLPTTGLRDGATITFAKRITSSPAIKSAVHSIWTSNGIDSTHEGVLFDIGREIRAIWVLASNRWELG